MQMRTIRDEISSWVSKKRVEGRLKVLRRWCKTFWLEWSKTVIFVVYGLLVYDSQVIEQQHDSSSDAQLMMICCCVDNIDLRRKNVFFTAWLIRSVDCDTKLASSTCFSLKMRLPHRLLKGTFTETSAQTSKGTKRQDSFLKVLDFLYCLYCLYAESFRYKNDECTPSQHIDLKSFTESSLQDSRRRHFVKKKDRTKEMFLLCLSWHYCSCLFWSFWTWRPFLLW